MSRTSFGASRTDVDLGAPEAVPLLADDGPADRAWRLLEAPDDMGWVTAGKLLARKRPQLIPVYDRVVRCAFGAPKPMWQWLHELCADRDGELPQRLQAIRATSAGTRARVSVGVAGAGDPPASSAAPAIPRGRSGGGSPSARVLDVIIWMRHRRSHQPSRCPRAEFTAQQ
jgi:hypothetical protein